MALHHLGVAVDGAFELLQRVLAVARQLNYQVDKNASNLRRQRSSTLALLIFEDPTPDDSAIS